MYSKILSYSHGLLFLIIIVSFNADAADRPNSSDHSLLSRYPDTEIIHYTSQEFESYTIPLGMLKKTGSFEYESNKTKRVEGKLIRLVYSTADGSSDVQIYKNYQQALSAPGFKTIYTCSKESCGGSVKAMGRLLAQKGTQYSHKEPAYYTVAKYDREGAGPIYFVVLNGKKTGGKVRIVVNVIETKSIELDLITTDPDTLLENIQMVGKAEIYDIFFDTGESAIKTESRAALEAITEALNRQPDLNVYVVGHTDDTGSLATNKKLSNDRANAIVDRLTTTHSIDPKRLHAIGVGPFAPIGSNEIESGRAKNRRVELVKRLD